jgi:hypothetical protein
MMLLIYEDGTATTLEGDLLAEHLEGFDSGILDVFDLSNPVTRLNADMQWEEVAQEPKP